MNVGNYITGLDLGTTKVVAVIAEVISESNVRILGFGVAKSEGLHKGLVSNIQKTADAIKEAIAIASNQCNLKVTEVNVGVAGEHISSMRHRNFVTITNEEHEITPDDLQRLEDDVRRIRIPMDMQILHVIPEEFVVDSLGSVKDPLGMSAIKLEAANHVVLASVPAILNIKKSVERAGFIVEDYVLQPLASAASILADNEKEVGVLMIDIGGGTTDIAVINRHAIIHSKVLGIAGNQVTNDIREALGTMTDEAENLKKKYGYATEKAIIRDEEIVIKGIGAWGSQSIPVSLLTQIIHARMREIFNLVDNEIRSAGLKNKIRGGVIITGGGSLLRGCAELASEIFGLPARIGVPLESNTGSLSALEKPEYSTVIGLLRGAPGKKITSKVSTDIKFEKGKSKKVSKKSANMENSSHISAKVKQVYINFKEFWEKF